MDNVLALLATTKYQDELGVWHEETTPRCVFCQVHSVTQTEFFNGGRNGLNPAYRFTVFQGDYEDEQFCNFEGKDYAIYRTYIVPGTDYIELYVERQGGANGKSETGATATNVGGNS